MFNGQVYYGELGYLQLLSDVFRNGVEIPDRTGVGSRALFDSKIIFRPGEFPFSTVRPLPLKKAFLEFWFFMQGKTQTKELEAQGVNFWQANTTRDFLDGRGLTKLNEGELGMAYGYQWRGFNRGLVHSNSLIVDQLDQTFKTLRSDPYSRRIYTTFWNPSASPFMALTPCWHSHQFVVLPDEQGRDTLHLKVLSRSLDVPFGFYMGAMQYRLYQMCMAQLLGMEVGAASFDLTQTHIYTNQYDYVAEILTREAGKQGSVTIKKQLNTM